MCFHAKTLQCKIEIQKFYGLLDQNKWPKYNVPFLVIRLNKLASKIQQIFKVIIQQYISEPSVKMERELIIWWQPMVDIFTQAISFNRDNKPER